MQSKLGSVVRWLPVFCQRLPARYAESWRFRVITLTTTFLCRLYGSVTRTTGLFMGFEIYKSGF